MNIDARSAQKAERVVSQVLDRLPATARGLGMERHPDQYYNASFATHHTGRWQELVIEVIELAQHLGYSPWAMTLDEAALDLSTDKTSVSGCMAMHAFLSPVAVGG